MRATLQLVGILAPNKLIISILVRMLAAYYFCPFIKTADVVSRTDFALSKVQSRCGLLYLFFIIGSFHIST